MKVKYTRNILALLLSFILFLTGCCDFTARTDESDPELDESEAFDLYLQELFADRISGNYFDYHYTVQDPEHFDFGLEKPESAWGEFRIDDYINYEADVSEELDRLTSYNYHSLTDEQKYIYDINLFYYRNELSGAPCYLLVSNFNTSGIQSQIPILFSEYALYTREDIEDYLTLMEESYDYIGALLEYEIYRAEQGYRLTDYTIDSVMESCQEFIDSDPNVLDTVFEEKLNAFPGLTEEEKQAYLERNRKYLEESMIPAYESIISVLEETKTLCDAPLPLGETEEGKKYYEYLIRYYTGTEKTIRRLKRMSENGFWDHMGKIQDIYEYNPDSYDEYLEYQAPEKAPEEILLKLQEQIRSDFPDTVSPSYEVKYVSKALESSLSPAFYMVPPIDNKSSNVIYINGSSEYDSYDLYPLMAHEGFPGHLYQQNYFNSTHPHPIRHTTEFLGYAEGWATYVEHYYGYPFSGMNEECAELALCDSLLGLAVSTLIDFGVNYYCWTVDDVSEFLDDMGYSADIAEEMYHIVMDDPGVYSSYYIGCLEILNMKKRAELELGDEFDIRSFHQFLLDAGPAPFFLIDERMDLWLNQ